MQLIKDRFVRTWILKDDMRLLASEGDDLAQTLAENFEHPLDLMFLTPQRDLVSKLNSFQDFPNVHLDVAVPPVVKRRSQQKSGPRGRLLRAFRKHRLALARATAAPPFPRAPGETFSVLAPPPREIWNGHPAFVKFFTEADQFFSLTMWRISLAPFPVL